MTSNSDSELWIKIPWKKLRKNLFRLQCRLWKAIREGDRKRANSLQKLILKSRSARLLAIRQVTQLNNGKKTAGVDGKASLNFQERFELEVLLKQKAHAWTHSKLREIPIPKKDGSKRILKVPTVCPYCTLIQESLGIFYFALVFPYSRDFLAQR
ncbi:MAG: reverse transcriptase N-terminal domain-containing protein [Nostoc sp. DedQUE01]